MVLRYGGISGMELLYDGMGADLDNLAMRRSSVRGCLRDSGAGRKEVGENRQHLAFRSRWLPEG